MAEDFLDEDGWALSPPTPWPTYWHGRKWDAPLTDESTEMDEALAAALLDGSTVCTLCEEPLLFEDDVFLTPSMVTHLECNIRMALGDVPHLEGRCMCNGGTGDHDDRPFRESAKATIEWLITNHRGRFHP